MYILKYGMENIWKLKEYSTTVYFVLQIKIITLPFIDFSTAPYLIYTGCGNCIRILPNQNKSSNLGFLALKIESTIWIFWKKVYESNPRFESLRFGFTNPDLQVRQPRFVRIRDWRIRIFKDSFCATVQMIHEDSWGFIGFVKIGGIFENWLNSWLPIWNKSF
jgi:hypothetical protein